MNFGKITNVILIGGTQNLLDACSYLNENEIEFNIFSSERHLKDITIKGTLESELNKNNILFYESDNINNDKKFLDLINSNTLCLSLSAPWIIKQSTIDKLNGNIVNLHSTRLPQNRGGGNISWQILQSNKLGMCLFHMIDSGIDTGDIIDYEEYLYPNYCVKPIDFIKFKFTKDGNFIKTFLDKVFNEIDFKLQKQSEYFSSYWPRLNTEINGFIDWSWDIEDIHRFICAFDDPYDGASTFLEKNHVYLKDSKIDLNEGSFHPFQRGLIYRINSNGIFIAVKSGALIIKNVFDKNKKDVTKLIKLGSRFTTPNKYLEEALDKRIIYTPKGLKR